MKIFIDDSGGFGWAPPGISLFCALTVSDRAIDKLAEQFSTWKLRQTTSTTDTELKGKDLSQLQQASFTNSIVLANYGHQLTLAGTNTASFGRTAAEHYLTDSVNIIRAGAERAERLKKPELAKFYGGMSRWVADRSPENVLWLLTLSKAIELSIQHAIVMFADEPQGHEFEDIEIIIDKSFIRKERHLEFWSEWLRTYLFRRSWMTPREWSEQHPFNRKYRQRPGILIMNDLFRNHMRFADSKDIPGVQIADVCANICYRRYSGSPKYRPYRLLRSKIRRIHGRELHIGILSESSHIADAPGSHVTFFDGDDMERWAKEAAAASID